MAGRCKFVFRPTHWPAAPSRLTGPEPCPYPSLPGSDFCAFHDPGLVSTLCSTPAEVADIYRETVQSVGVLKLLGCTVLHLDCQRLRGVLDPGQPVNIGYSTFEAPLDFSQFDFEKTVTIAGCTIPSLSLQETSISGYLNLWDSTVASFDLREAELHGDAHFENTVFGDATFNNATFHGVASFCEQEPADATINEVSDQVGTGGAEFIQPAQFLGTEFNHLAIFAGVTFHTAGIFSDAVFRTGGSFKRLSAAVGMHFGSARFLGRVDFSEAALGYTGFNSAHFEDICRFSNTTFGGAFPPYLTSAVNNHSHAEGIHSQEAYARACQTAMNDAFYAYLAEQMQDLSASFAGARPDDYFYIEDVTATSPIEFTNLTFDYLELDARIMRHRNDAVSLEGAMINRGELTVTPGDHTRYQLTHATLGAVGLDWPAEENAFDKLLVADTRFDGFDFSDYRRSLSKADWTIDGVAIRDDQQIPLKRETTYSKAKAGAARQGDSLAESKFLIKERRFRRARYQAEVNSADTYTAKAKISLNFVTNYLYDFTCEYGENPRRVLALSLGSIVLFAALYWLLDVGIPTPSTVTFAFAPRAAVEYLTFSLQAFTAFFIPGAFSPGSQALRLLSALQSFVGAFTIALFVATIVRTVER